MAPIFRKSAVPATTVVAFIFSTLPLERFFLFDVINFIVFAILATIGIWMSIRSLSRLEKIREKKEMLHDHETELIRSAESINELLGKLMVVEEETKDRF